MVKSLTVFGSYIVRDGDIVCHFSSKQKFVFIKRVDNGWITTVKDLESWGFERYPSSERIEELWVLWFIWEYRGALPFVEIWSHEFVNKLVEWEALITGNSPRRTINSEDCGKQERTVVTIHELVISPPGRFATGQFATGQIATRSF